MRKILFAASAGMLCCCTSCNNSGTASGGMSDKAQKNLDAAHVVVRAFETGDAGKLDSVISPDFIDHTDMGDKKGVDSLKSMVNQMHTMFKDMKMETKKEWADDDYVSEWVEYTGNNPTAMPGVPVGPYDMKGIELTRFADGKAVEHWFFMDNQSMMEMMKNMGTPGMDNSMNKSDTTRMKNK